jgi:hypothetical protein
MSMASVRSSGNPAEDAGWTQGTVAAWAGVLLLVGLIAFGIAWFLGWIRFTTDPRVVEIRQMQEDARRKFVATGGPSTIAEATEAVATMAQIRQKVQSLPENLRPEVERQGQGVFFAAMRARIDRYFSLPPEKRVAELDRQIKQEELMRKAWETGGAVMNALTGGASGGGQGGGQAGAPAADQSGGQGGGQGGPPAGGQAATAGTGGSAVPGGPRGGPPQNGNEDDRNKWRKEMIDRTTPEQRARYTEYRRVMTERRTQLGLPSFGPR